MIKVKLICSWTDSPTICRSWNKMSQGDYNWNNVKIVSNDSEKPDYYCLINYTNDKNSYIPAKTIYMLMEPRHHILPQWPDPKKIAFFSVLSRNNIEWHLSKTYKQLLEEPIIKTQCLSTVVSDKYNDPGHIKRIDFLRYLHQQEFEFEFDLYGQSNRFNFSHYRGSLPIWQKDSGILPYKYTIACENSSHPNYFTEKIVDAILGECLCFYWGCPNISDYIDRDAYIILDLDDFEKSFKIIKEAIATDQWEVKIEIIKKEKLKILNDLQFFPTLEKIILSKIGAPVTLSV